MSCSPAVRNHRPRTSARPRKQSCSSRSECSRWSWSGLHNLAVLTPMNDVIWSILTTGSSRLATNVSCLDWHDPPTTTSQFLSVIPRWRSWPGLMPSTWRIPPVVAAGLFTIWPEMVFRSVAIECLTSCAVWVYGQSTRNQRRPFQVALRSGFPVWWTSTR